MIVRRIAALLVCALAALSSPAAEVAKADLDILGTSLEVDRNRVLTAVDVPAYVQTKFGGKMNDEAPLAETLSAVGELTGPGLDRPITLITKPGHRFALPALHEKGEYALQNIRLVNQAGEFLMQAVPSFAAIEVADILQTSVRVRQLTPEELRARGIVVDTRNFEVYEYEFVFGVEGQQVVVPYPVIVDRRTHEVAPVDKENPYALPELSNQTPPRFTPPTVVPFEFAEPEGGELPPPSTSRDPRQAPRPSIPAALVVPSGFGVLHQFFGVMLQVDNAAPPGATIRLDRVTATIDVPTQLRVAKVLPAVAFGQPVPIRAADGSSYLLAGAQGKAEWTLEALKSGTHTVTITVDATYQKPGDPDIPLRGKVSTTLVVSDPRFQINFSHPDTVREGEPYTAYAFVTNLSPQRQHVVLDTSEIPPCSNGTHVENICRTEGSGTFELDLGPGEMKPVPYKLSSRETGRVFAAAGTANDAALGVSVKLTMGVSRSGIPLSPATLILPHYAQWVPSRIVDSTLHLLGLGYSLAVAPLTQSTATKPRVIKTDVFRRAQDIARAGQRIFIARADRDTNDPATNIHAIEQLALDLLGNIERPDQLATAPELREWDELRRAEESGRDAAAAMARQLETDGLANGKTPAQFVNEFVANTSHRAPFLFAYARGGASIAIAGKTSSGVLAGAAEGTTWTRTLPYGEVTKFGDDGEMALVGRWKEDVRIAVTPSSTSFTLHLMWPDSANGFLRADVEVTNATPGSAIAFDLVRGARTLTINGVSANVSVVEPTPVQIIGAAQDLHLEEGGHLVSLLFNRPIGAVNQETLRDRFALTTKVPAANYEVTRRNDGTTLQVPGATLQDDGRILHVSFDKTLSRNAQYAIAVDDVNGFNASNVVPRIDNDRPGGILTGRVLRGDNSAVANAVVELISNDVRQLDLSGADGRYLFEFVPRDIDSGISGAYVLSTAAEGKAAQVEGSVRLPGEVHTVNLQFLGRGSAQGQVRYSDGAAIPNVIVTVGSTLFNQFRFGTTGADGKYVITDLPVGPLTFSVVDGEGRPTFAANQIQTPGQVVTQDLVIQRRESPGLGAVRVIVKRSDTNAVVPNARVGVYVQGYGLQEGYTDANGFYEFARVPAGLVSILAAEFSVTRESVGVELDLRADQTLETTVVLPVPKATDAAYATLEGTVKRDNPAAPDVANDQFAPGAILSIAGLPPVTVNADGTYVYAEVPLSFSGRRMTVYDPATGRRGQFSLPTLVSGTNHFPIRLTSAAPEGFATMRVRLTGARGEPVTGYRVISPGFPPIAFTDKGNGVYERENVRVPVTWDVAAVPSNPSGSYGEQFVEGTVRVDFHGQIGVADLRLPGHGTIITKLEGGNGSQILGPAAITYRVWDEAEQGIGLRRVEVNQDATSGLVTFTKIPTRQTVTVETVRNPAGYASAQVQLTYDGEARNVTLTMQDLGDVTGRVFAHDLQTPISGATVRLTGGPADYGVKITNPDGSFRFPAVAANTSFRLVADYTQDGVYRTGYVDGATPQGGGPVSNLVIVLREQASIEGQVLDLSDQPVALARYWARELAWPYRTFGTPQEPLVADINGRFLLTNVFTGPFRITAVDPENQEIRGDYQGTLDGEGDISQRAIRVRVGGGGIGDVSVRVVDPDRAFAPVANAEVALWRGSQRFDVTSTDENGSAYFGDVPAGTYSVSAYSKAFGRAGSSSSFTLDDGEVEAVRISLELRGEVSGDLKDPEAGNAAVKGAPVTLASGAVQTRASTDSLGAFEFLGVPEGPFRLTAFDLDSGRIAVGPEGLFISPLIKEQRNIHLELERTGTLTVKAYLPNDSGAAGELAPLADVTVEQKAGDSRVYLRGLQGNSLTFPKMLTRYGYEIVAREIGGEGRVVRASGSFSGLTKEHAIVFPTTGSVEVTVVDGNEQPVADAMVRINDRVVYTPATGVVTLSGLPFGWITVQASKGTVAASAGNTLASRAEPLRFRLNLGETISVTGKVEAELGLHQPSVDTRVAIEVRSSLLAQNLRLETRTDANGNYSFGGIPVGGTFLTLTFLGPDDVTVGARIRDLSVPNGTRGTFAIGTVKLSATPPRVLSITPATNATSVSPNTIVVVVFSEAIDAQFLNKNWFQLMAADETAPMNVTFVPTLNADLTYTVKLVPPAPPAGQTYALRSNVLYRFLIPQGIADTSGNVMTTPVGTSFTTVNYTEPSIVSVSPSEDLPLAANAEIRVKFNKAIALNSFEAGGNGTLTLEKLDGPNGVPVSEVTIAKRLDVSDASILVITPQGAPLEPSSFYRLVVAGARDTQDPPNTQKDVRIFHWASFDTIRPVVTIIAPPVEQPLVSRVLYTAVPRIVDEDTGAESKDIAYVDWLDGDGKVVARVKTAPFSYSFPAPATSTPTTYTLRASATDRSGLVSESMGSATWNVTPNEAPRSIVVTTTPASAYPTKQVETRVTFEDEGVRADLTLELVATAIDGSAIRTFVGDATVTRTSTAEPFPPAIFTYTLPQNLKDGSATLIASVKDAVDLTGTANGTLTVLADTLAPRLVSLTPAPESRFAFNQKIVVLFSVADDETAIARATMTIDGTSVTPTMSTANGVTTFRYEYDTPRRNADTRVRISATAYDLRDNPLTATTDIIYERRDDASVPSAAWITPLDGAALPYAHSGWKATLRVRATDDTKVTSVRFESSAISGGALTVTSPRAGTTDEYEVKTELALTSDAPFVIKAIVSDGTPEHDVELPITIDPVAIDVTVDGPIGITESMLPQYQDKNVLVKGTSALVYLPVPLRVKNLIVVDGAALSNPEETKLDLTITERFFVDADSRVDLDRRGFLGGWRNREGNSLTNQTPTARTLNGPGATGGGSGSHAGIGGLFGYVQDGIAYTGTTNSTYGSITEPFDFGAGGSGGASSSQRGENGGGAARIRGGAGLARFVVAGNITANGGHCDDSHACGAGGSIWLQSRALVTGPKTRITANGGDEGNVADLDLGGGGGRIAVRATERLEFSANTLQARGGRNGGVNAQEGPQYVDGGAGTIHLVRPGATLGELIVSAFDERRPSSTHRTRGTPLSGDLQFDAITIGPRALARFDAAHSGTMTVDASALVVEASDLPTLTITALAPPANAQVAQNTSITATFDAASAAGIGDVRAVLTMAERLALTRSFPATISGGSIAVTIPADAATGATTLKLRATDRAGRVIESQPVDYTVATNAAARIDEFLVTPSTEMYAGHTIHVSAKASDDVSVADLTLASTIGEVVPDALARPTPQSATRTFRVNVPPTATGEVTLTLRATDTYPNRPATVATHKITLTPDTIKPSLTVALPQPNQQYEEGTGNTIAIEATALDAEVAIKEVKVTFNSATIALTPNGNVHRGSVAVPQIDGSDNVPVTMTIAAFDYAGNVTSVEVPVVIKPLIRPDAPDMAWVCTSPGALYPRGYEVPIRFTAIPKSSDNGVAAATVSIDGQPAINATLAGTNTYEVKFTIPADATVGHIYKVRAASRSVSDADASLLTSFTVVGGTPLVNTSSVIEAQNLGSDNTSIVVGSGSTLTIIGPHRFTHLVVLSGGTVVQKHADLAGADRIEVANLYVACGGKIDVSHLGYAASTSYPGAGWSDDSSGGSHIGQGGTHHRQSGGTFGSVYEPREAGGGGHIRSATPPAEAMGGGQVRIHAPGSISIDGDILANGKASSNGGGAGGSIWLTTAGTFSGNGKLEANGASANNGDGGGGAIALEYASLSGNVAKNASAKSGSVQGDTLPAAAGSIYTRRTGTAGDLRVENTTSNTFSATALPSFGVHTASAVDGANVTLTSNAFVSPSLIGHRIRAIAPDGTTRGTYRLANVTKHATTRIAGTTLTIATQDGIAYDGYLLYSTTGLGAEKRTFAAVRKNGAQWQYDSDSAFLNFAPAAGDFVFAAFRKSASAITDVTMFRCNGTCGSVDGLPMVELVGSELLANFSANTTDGLQLADAHEFMFRPDGFRRGIILSGGPATITLEGATNVQPGDTLRGVYVFDNLVAKNARIRTDDLIESANVPQLEASVIERANEAAPSIDLAKISIVHGAEGATIVGQLNAIKDADGAIEVTARNLARAVPTNNFIAPSNGVSAGASGGLSLFHVPNGRTDAAASTLVPITGSGFAQWTLAQNDVEMQVSLAPNDVAVFYDEPGHQSFRFLANGTYQIWANAANTGKTGTYTAMQPFRLEKSGTTLRWYANNVLVHEVSGVPESLLLQFPLPNMDRGEIASIEWASSERAHCRAKVEADGSFRLPVRGNAGDAIVLRARDNHRTTFTTRDLSIGTIPNDLGVASLTFAPSEVTGGRTSIGTVTLKAAAPSDGAIVELSSADARVTVPRTITVAAGQTTATFNATTVAVTDPTDVAVSARYGGIGVSTTLRIVRDNIAPLATLDAPAENTAFSEGSTFTVLVTASDADSGMKSVRAVIDGISTPLTKGSGNSWSASVAAPFIDGTANVTKTLAVIATDNTDNSATLTRSIVITPVISSAAPTLTWSACGRYATYPAGHSAKIRITAAAPAANNPIRAVDAFIGSEGPIAMPLVGGNDYELTWTVPSINATTEYPIRVVAYTAGDASAELPGHITAIVADKTFTSGGTIAANDTSWDDKTVVVTAGTLTISGAHRFAHLVILGGTVTHPQMDAAGHGAFDLTATGRLFVACGAFIDVSERGYASGVTYPGSTLPSSGGGSHIGEGGADGTNTRGSTFGSVVTPRESGGTGSGSSGRGGGVAQLRASTVAIDGTISANGGGSSVGGAAGSVLIQTDRITGIGTIEANGGGGYASGAGGAIAIHYTDAASIVPSLRTTPGGTVCCNSDYPRGGSGTVFLKGPQHTHGELHLGNGATSHQLTRLPALGSGIAASGTTGATLATGRASIPAFFAGHWIEITDPATKTLKGTWKIASISGGTITLAPNANETIALAQGDQWQGVYRFDRVVIARASKLTSADPLRVQHLELTGTSGENPVELHDPVTGATTITTSGPSRARELSASTLTIGGSMSVIGSTLTLAGTNVTITGTVSADGAGYAKGTTYPGETLGASMPGAHMGLGGADTTPPPQGTFGSVERPRELGGGSSNSGAGGGAVRIDATNLTVSGTISANGEGNSFGGGGGSIWITTGSIAGSGIIQANGGGGYATGGGGAVAVHYTNASSVLPTLRAFTGASVCCNSGYPKGGAGTVLVRGPQNTYGELRADGTNGAQQLTLLPSLGSGIAQSGTSGATLVTAIDVPAFFAGHWVEIASKGTWRIASIDGRSVTLAPNGSETISLAPGDAWQGIYRFDKLVLRNGAQLASFDRIDATSNDAPSSLVPHNAAPPSFDLARIAVESSAGGDAVVGLTSAVTDANQPVRLTVKNTRTSAAFTGNANADGSFRIAVTGALGDTFTISGTDTNPLSRTSPALNVPGAISEWNSIASMTFAPTTVSAGNTVTATLRLRYAASNAKTIALASNTSAITIPTTVIVPTGQSAAQFTITTSAAADASITATFGTSSVSETLRVVSGTSDLASLVLTPASVQGGTSVTGTVSLGAAAASDALVTLTSSDTARASVPSQVTILAGQTSATFTVTTMPVASATTVNITASYGATHAVTLDLAACSSIGSVAKPSNASLSTTWFDDTATITGSGATIDTTQSASGTSAIHFTAASGARGAGFSGASALTVAPSDRIVFHVLANPCNPPRQILLTWTGSTTLRTSLGESLVNATTANTILGSIPTSGEWTRVEVLARTLGITSTASLTGLSIDVHDGEAWVDAIGTSACSTSTASVPPFDANEELWFDDDLPAGASGSNWNWSTAQRASGSRSFTHPASTAAHEQSFAGATKTLLTRQGDLLFTWVYLDPCNPPRQIILTYSVGSDWEHRAYWGENLTIPWKNGNANTRIGPLPEAGKWVRLEVPAAQIGLVDASITGYGFSLYDGNAWGDRVGRIARVNLARAGTATQSSTYTSGASVHEARYAIDGNTAGAASLFAHTLNTDPQPWWQLDLGSVQSIEDIQLWNVNDGSESRLNNFFLFVSDVPFTSTTFEGARAQSGVSTYYMSGQAPRSSTWRISRTGRYIRVQLPRPEYLVIPELQVWAPVSRQQVNLAGGRAATQSSDHDGYGRAPGAVNGDTNALYRASFSFSHTSEEANAWWELDLGAVQPISSIEIHNRPDSGQDRLSNYYVLVSDVPFASQTLSATLAQSSVARYFLGTWRWITTIPLHRTGRYIRIQHNGTAPLVMSEVRVLSQQTTLAPLARPTEIE